jgi:hypothetical protein
VAWPGRNTSRLDARTFFVLNELYGKSSRGNIFEYYSDMDVGTP